MYCKNRKIEMTPSYNSMFINRSTNYTPSTLKDQAQRECHKRAVRENNEMHARTSGISLPVWKVVQTIPEDSEIKKCVKKMTNGQRVLAKLFHITYFITQMGHAFASFKDMMDLEKLQGVEFQFGSYENKQPVATLWTLCNGSTDISVTEQEVVYVSNRDPVTLWPALKFFNIVSPTDSQDTPGLEEIIKDSLKNKIWNVSLIKFLSSDPTSVNSGKNCK